MKARVLMISSKVFEVCSDALVPTWYKLGINYGISHLFQYDIIPLSTIVTRTQHLKFYF